MNTSTPGEAALSLMGSIAEFEREDAERQRVVSLRQKRKEIQGRA